ncbi:hypothetical protein ACIBG8_45005 [Nonomuraea sp. NPDC050556]|uniref:DUF7927 domain-containing protein n=1 Tax=Nonomuraea sp. NPDC050556 TaxID=3364369 RepID=UPI0037ACD9CA
MRGRLTLAAGVGAALLLVTPAVQADDQGDPPPDSGTDTALVQSIDVRHTATPARIERGGVAHYKLSVSSGRGLPADDVEVKIDLTDVQDDQARLYAVKATRGAAKVQGHELIWSDDLPAGATATVTFDVAVTKAKSGNDVLTTKASDNFYACDSACTTKVVIEDEPPRRRHRHHHRGHPHEKPPLRPR